MARCRRIVSSGIVSGVLEVVRHVGSAKPPLPAAKATRFVNFDWIVPNLS
jgi:hypothetical protein